ncbi:MAG: thiamine pyrophosphate-dependent enzyme [Bacteroidales bacterium]
MTEMVLLGDEAVALGAVHAGLTASYAYPGTPSTEITEYLLRYTARHGKPRAAWCTNEKTAYEEALGVSLVGRRALVSMKHVGLNVASDPFMNSALISIHGGLVVVVADDPGMHSSQNEQDTRYYADFARVICLEPANQQEAYEMTREAFDLSEKFHIPVVIRLVTRLAHSRAIVRLGAQRDENPVSKAADWKQWTLLPNNARAQWRSLLERQKDFLAYAESTDHNPLTLTDRHDIGIITTGLARNYYMENVPDLGATPSHLHIGAYPIPVGKIRELASQVAKVLVLEEGYPLVERYLRGIIPPGIAIAGKESGDVPADGELTPDIVRRALGLRVGTGVELPAGVTLANRPPQLCDGCPHADSLDALHEALKQCDTSLVTSDIGCYTLGALPPYSAVESCVCMGASVGMAKGAAEAGFHPAVGVIGDSTFLHSGITPLIDAVAANTDMTLVIVDNQAVAMTGGQQTMLPSSSLKPLVLGLGVDPEHCHVLKAHRTATKANIEIIKKELDYHGLSVIITVRECIETLKAKKKDAAAAKETRA